MEGTRFNKNRAVIQGGDIFAVESEKNLTLQDVSIQNLESMDSIYMETIQFFARRLTIKRKSEILTVF